MTGEKHNSKEGARAASICKVPEVATKDLPKVTKDIDTIKSIIDSRTKAIIMNNNTDRVMVPYPVVMFQPMYMFPCRFCPRLYHDRVELSIHFSKDHANSEEFTIDHNSDQENIQVDTSRKFTCKDFNPSDEMIEEARAVLEGRLIPKAQPERTYQSVARAAYQEKHQQHQESHQNQLQDRPHIDDSMNYKNETSEGQEKRQQHEESYQKHLQDRCHTNDDMNYRNETSEGQEKRQQHEESYQEQFQAGPETYDDKYYKNETSEYKHQNHFTNHEDNFKEAEQVHKTPHEEETSELLRQPDLTKKSYKSYIDFNDLNESMKGQNGKNLEMFALDGVVIKEEPEDTDFDSLPSDDDWNEIMEDDLDSNQDMILKDRTTQGCKMSRGEAIIKQVPGETDLNTPHNNTDSFKLAETSHPEINAGENLCLEIKQFTCKYCNEVFKDKVDLTEHLILHKAKEKCPFCGKNFIRKFALKRHLGDLYEAVAKEQSNAPTNTLRTDVGVAEKGEFGQNGLYVQNKSIVTKWYQSNDKSHESRRTSAATDISMKEEKLIKESDASQNDVDIQSNNFTNKSCQTYDEPCDREQKGEFQDFTVREENSCGSLNDSDTRKQTYFEKQHECYICKKRLPLASCLSHHIEMHRYDNESAPNRFRCWECGKNCFMDLALKRHMRTHRPPGLKCEVCPRTLASEESLRKHLMNVHNGLRTIVCNICGAELACIASLAAHIRKHEEQRRFVCERCGMVFYSEKALKAHVGIHVVELLIKCDKCNTYFFELSELDEHKSIKHGPKKARTRKWKCQECSEVFNSLQARSSHVAQAHRKEKHITCELCEKAFHHDSVYQKHLQTHNEKAKRKHRFTCEHCNKTFEFDYYYQRHLKSHMKSPNGPAKNAQCPECSKMLSSKKTLEAHMRRHHRESRFHCEECGKGFYFSYDYRAHMKIHNQETVERKKGSEMITD